MNEDNPKIGQSDSVETRVNQVLDASIDDLSPDVRRKLNQARMVAIERKSTAQVYWKPVMSLSFAAVLMIGWQLNKEPEPITESLFAEVMQEDFELLSELEFIYWMAESEDSAEL